MGTFSFPFLVLKHVLALSHIFVGRTSVYLLPRGCQTTFGDVTVSGAPDVSWRRILWLEAGGQYRNFRRCTWVRGYVTQSGNAAYTPSGAARKATTSERKAFLATMGRRGGQKAAQRWETDPEGAYAKVQRETLAAANKRRTLQGAGTRGRVLAVYSQTLFDTGEVPTARQIAEEIGCERSTVARHISALKRLRPLVWCNAC